LDRQIEEEFRARFWKGKRVDHPGLGWGVDLVELGRGWGDLRLSYGGWGLTTLS
jgi:hypothetical protein